VWTGLQTLSRGTASEVLGRVREVWDTWFLQAGRESFFLLFLEEFPLELINLNMVFKAHFLQ